MLLTRKQHPPLPNNNPHPPAPNNNPPLLFEHPPNHNPEQVITLPPPRIVRKIRTPCPSITNPPSADIVATVTSPPHTNNSRRPVVLLNHDPPRLFRWSLVGGAQSPSQKGSNGIRTRRITRNFAQINLTTAKPLGGVAGDARGIICDAGDVWLHVLSDPGNISLPSLKLTFQTVCFWAPPSVEARKISFSLEKTNFSGSRTFVFEPLN